MRILINIFIVLLIGLGLGGLSADFALQRSLQVGAVTTGSWTAWPFVGGAEVDPYTSAKATTSGSIPLGAAEGLAFEATRDREGKNLSATCTYEIAGSTSTARMWTLTAYDLDGKLILNDGVFVSGIYSGNIVRFPDSSFVVHVGSTPSSGNWLPIRGDSRMKLVLRLYDTPITSNSGLADTQMPRIQSTGCQK